MGYDKDMEIFGGKTFGSLAKTIYGNVKKKDRELSKLMAKIDTFIVDDATAKEMVPVLRDYFEASIKNDDQLVKLAAIVQRAMTKGSESEDGFFLTDEDREKLIETYKQSEVEKEEIGKKYDEYKGKVAE